MVEELALSPGAAVLDVGCGTGRHSIELARRGYAVTGLDVSSAMLAKAKQAAQAAGMNVNWIQSYKELREPETYTFNEYGVDNGSTIAYDGPSREYAVDPDGAGPAETLSFTNPDFNLTSLRGNAVIRWEFLPGSTAFLVWTHSNYSDADPGSLDFGRDFSKAFSTVNYDDVFMLKVAYWIHP